MFACNQDVTAPLAACSPPRLGPFLPLSLPLLYVHLFCAILFSYSNSALPLPLPATPTVPPLPPFSHPLSQSSLCLSIRRRREAPQRDCGSFPLPPTLA